MSNAQIKEAHAGFKLALAKLRTCRDIVERRTVLVLLRRLLAKMHRLRKARFGACRSILGGNAEGNKVR
jgi:hypothetical protein